MTSKPIMDQHPDFPPPAYAPPPYQPNPPYPQSGVNNYAYLPDNAGVPPQSGYMGPNPNQTVPPEPHSIPLQSGEPPINTECGFSGVGFDDRSIRHAFVRKVYLILTAQLLVTCAFICLFQFVQPIQDWVRLNMWFYIVSYVVFITTYITLICCPGVRRSYPGNFIALSVFTLVLSYMVATIATFHQTYIVITAAGITTIVCLAVSLCAIQTRIDFTKCGLFLFVLCLAVMLMGFSVLILWRVNPNGGSAYLLSGVYGGLAAILFALFLAYDTQVVLGGRKYELSPEEYIYGALQLYLDIVYLFIILLGLMGGKK